MTAVDWLVEQLQKEYKWFPSTQSELIVKAKEMECKQMNPDNEECQCFRLGEGSEWQTYLCDIHE